MHFTALPEGSSARPVLGLLLLTSDETLEQDMRAGVTADEAMVHSARVASAAEVSTESLAAMADTLTKGATDLPAAATYDVIGYGCTSATAVLGAPRVAQMVQAGRAARAVTTPLDALVAACAHLGVSRLAVLSPYVAEVSEQLRVALSERGIETPVFGSFDEPSEAAVARISSASTIKAGGALGTADAAEALFLSCTNLPTRAAIPALTAQLGKPVLSSNSVLVWHMRRLAGLPDLGLGH